MLRRYTGSAVSANSAANASTAFSYRPAAKFARASSSRLSIGTARATAPAASNMARRAPRELRYRMIGPCRICGGIFQLHSNRSPGGSTTSRAPGVARHRIASLATVGELLRRDDEVGLDSETAATSTVGVRGQNRIPWSGNSVVRGRRQADGHEAVAMAEHTKAKHPPSDRAPWMRPDHPSERELLLCLGRRRRCRRRLHLLGLLGGFLFGSRAGRSC